MTAPDYVAQVAELLGQHFADEGLNVCEAKRCKFETWDLPFAERLAAFAAHQAEVLAAAGLIPTHTEWGVAWRGVPQVSLGGPLTEDEARSRANHDFTLIARAVTDWKDAT
jgi:hypothetical protein